MAKYKVLKGFKDKRTGEVYRRGQEIEMTVKRANEAISNLESYGGNFICRIDEDSEDTNQSEVD